jgi:L-alanine-DL-glutamate epimerase-like enolase superfamily enzyme
MDAVKEYDIGFMEEPIPPENIDVMKKLTGMGKVPIASGERIYTTYGFRNLLTSQAVNIIQPDIARTGGITEMKKIASFAETYYVPVAPHNANSPLATVAAIHFAASTPNFMSLEYLVKDVEWRDSFMTPAIEVKDGYISIPEGSGLGVELDCAFIKKAAHTVSET